MNKIQIIIATHKKYKMPDTNKKNYSMYLPLQVGAKKKEKIGYETDDTGENISLKNPYFCELTGLYWAYKNLKVDYIGLVHYRRYFTLEKKSKKQGDKFDSVLTLKQVDNLLKTTDVILPKKRNYYIENLYDHYKHTMYVEPLDITREILKEKYPEYLVEFDNLHKRKSAHMFNMFIMKKDIFDGYMQWLFDILFALEKKVDITVYDAFHARFFGRISELLLDVYINTNHIEYKEIRVMDMEDINWRKKGISFLRAKFFGEKYDKSF